MDAAEVAARVRALEAELAAVSPRIADLEARVSVLEAENARWRRAVLRGETFGRLEEGLSGSEKEAAQKVGAPFDAVGDGDEEGMDADVSVRRSADGRVLALSTPTKLAMRAVTGGSNEEDEMDDAGGGGGGGDNNAGLDDEDFSITLTPCGKKRARMITSDSEDEGENGEDDALQEWDVAPNRKRAFHGVGDSDNEEKGEGVGLQHASCVAEKRIEENVEDDDDDKIPILQVVKKRREERMRKEMMRLDEHKLGDTKGRSITTKRRSARIVENQSKKARFAQWNRDLVKLNDYVESKDDSEKVDGTHEFDSDCSEKSSEQEDSGIEMGHTLLKDVTQESHRWRVRVKITRISSKYQPQLNFVMLDEQGYAHTGVFSQR